MIEKAQKEEGQAKGKEDTTLAGTSVKTLNHLD